jgi:hypothetical protein
MAFEHYTRCIQPADFVPRDAALIIGRSLILAPFAAVFTLALGDPLCWILVGEIVAMSAVIAYCRNWLYERLICLGGDRDAIGVVGHISAPSDALLDFDWDDDYSITLLLENCEFGDPAKTDEQLQAEAEVTLPSGELIKGQPGIFNPPVSRQTPGYITEDVHDAEHPGGTGKRFAGLHAEFEGAGNFNLLQVAQAGLAFSVAGLIACLALPFPADLIVGLALGILGLLALLIGGIISNFVRPGSPSDANPDIGELQTNTDPNEGKGAGADIVYVQGTWVYDSLHEGWNEIHPIKICTKYGTWTGEWDPDPVIILRIRQGFQEAQSDQTRANQARPKHQWRVHPDLDGCATVVIE